MESIPTDKLIKAYIRIRDERATIKSAYEQHDQQLQEKMAVIEAKLL